MAMLAKVLTAATLLHGIKDDLWDDLNASLLHKFAPKIVSSRITLNEKEKFDGLVH